MSDDSLTTTTTVVLRDWDFRAPGRVVASALGPPKPWGRLFAVVRRRRGVVRPGVDRSITRVAAPGFHLAGVALVVPLFSWGGLNPLKWLGDAASEAIGSAWTSAMVASWSAALWILGLAFKVVDAFTTPDLSGAGPLASVYPYTFGIGASLAVLMAFAQLGAAAFKRDGQSMARVLVGVGQFAAVWAGYVAVAAALVVAVSGLTHGLLQGLLGVDGFSGYKPGDGWPRDVTDTTTATVLGICSWLLIWPASIAYLLIMMAREAALLLLVCTSPIAAGGLLAEVGRTWFWRSLRWFLAALMIAPLSALVLGVGEKISQGVIAGTSHAPPAGGAGRAAVTATAHAANSAATVATAAGPGGSGGTDPTAAVGMAVVGCLLILIGALCPLVLFRMLAFVEPGTSSGAAMRSSLAAQGGLSGLLGGSGGGSGVQSVGSGAASQDDGAGRSSGEASADAATSTRFAGLGGMGGALVSGVGSLANNAVGLGADVLASAGVGHPQPYYPQPPPSSANRPASPGPGAGSGASSDVAQAPDDQIGGGGAVGAVLPDPPQIPSVGAPGAAGGVPGTGGEAGGPAAGGEAGAAAAVL